MEQFFYISQYIKAMMLFISTSLPSFLITFISTPFFIYIANKFNITDSPDGKLKVHKKTTPYLGGCAVFLAIFCAIIFIYYLYYYTNYLGVWNNSFGTFLESASIVIISLFALLFLGLLDDIKPMLPWQKFLGQFIIAIFLVYFGFIFNIIFLPLWINQIISIFWIVSIINAFNLVDIMDGLCSSVGLFAAFNFLILTCVNSLTDSFILALNISLIGSLLAFLYYNKPDARIYLGDAGSMALGGFFAIMSLSIKWEKIGIYGFLVPIALLVIPIYELCSLIIIRTYKGIPFYQGSPDHFAIYLQRYGLSKNKILFCVALINFNILPVIYFSQIFYCDNIRESLLIKISSYLFKSYK